MQVVLHLMNEIWLSCCQKGMSLIPCSKPQDELRLPKKTELLWFYELCIRKWLQSHFQKIRGLKSIDPQSGLCYFTEQNILQLSKFKDNASYMDKTI